MLDFAPFQMGLYLIF